MAKTVIVKLTDDLDGGEANETVHFALDGRSYEIDLNEANATRLRSALGPFVEKARERGARTQSAQSEKKSMYSRLSADEKARFRAWANMATARRISDTRVRSWVEAGRP